MFYFALRAHFSSALAHDRARGIVVVPSFVSGVCLSVLSCVALVVVSGVFLDTVPLARPHCIRFPPSQGHIKTPVPSGARWLNFGVQGKGVFPEADF